MKDRLLYYQGGGYSGCIWEWNFCFWDADGKWHNLFSTGCSGVKTEIEALKIVETLEHKAEVVKLMDKKCFEKFQENNNAHLVLSIAQQLNDKHGYSLEVKCTECECSFVADDYERDTATDNYNIICSDCLSIGTCDVCNEYSGPDELNRCNDDGDDDIGAELAEAGYYNVCNDCYEYKKEEYEQDELRNLRHKALSTGKPDIFSEELRGWWTG
ncbi:hypothetical protein LCGC14_0360410 [marine sediment metagenome]|uniref:Uncharacterized protein n=1 Tax=marine sediment metagenome TaxID=412755 RepID=A0A0F9TRB3_9ZZZZ|nr:hypothetical protein [bacterium]